MFGLHNIYSGGYHNSQLYLLTDPITWTLWFNEIYFPQFLSVLNTNSIYFTANKRVDHIFVRKSQSFNNTSRRLGEKPIFRMLLLFLTMYFVCAIKCFTPFLNFERAFSYEPTNFIFELYWDSQFEGDEHNHILFYFYFDILCSISFIVRNTKQQKWFLIRSWRKSSLELLWCLLNTKSPKA